MNQVGELESPWVMRNVNDVGPYALAAKPQTVAVTGMSLAFFRIKAIKGLNIPLPDQLHLWPSWIPVACEQLFGLGWTAAYSPLVLAHTAKAWPTKDETLPTSHISNSSGPHQLTRYGKHCPHRSYWPR